MKQRAKSLSAPLCAAFPAAAALFFSCAAQAMTLEFPGPAVPTANKQEELTSYRMPVGPWTATGTPTTLTEGALDQTAWRIDAPGLTTLQLMAPLRDQLTTAGFTPIYECETTACGGFDFRYGTDVLSEPAMHVDLGDFRYLAASRKTRAGAEHVSLFVSRSAASGFVQMIRIGAVPPPQVTASTKTPLAQPVGTAASPGDIGAKLESGGALVLEDLMFPSGTSELAEGDYLSLAALAAWLRANPTRPVALVGHTDASGALDTNIALSRKRAQAVRQRLIESFALPPEQIIAEGVGYLAPRDSNLTEDGRMKNRRVEVVPTSVE